MKKWFNTWKFKFNILVSRINNWFKQRKKRASNGAYDPWVDTRDDLNGRSA